MESLNSNATEHWLPQLRKQLRNCQCVEDVQTVLGRLDSAVVSGSQAEDVLYQLQAHSQAERLTELVLASGRWAEPLSVWLLETFPKSIDTYLLSIQHDVIDTLSLFLTFLPLSTSDRDVDATLRRFRTQVELTPQVMKELANFSPEGESASNEPEQSTLDNHTIGKKGRQSEQKRARKVKHQVTTFRLKDLQRLGIPEPCSKLEANTSAQRLLDEMQRILQEYLRILRRPEIAFVTQEGFARVQAPSTSASALQSVERSSVRVEETSQSIVPVVNRYVQPMKAALYFESAKGFGAWRILLSSGANSDLRAARRRDRHTFDIYIKKIKELSNGHFSADNHKRLNGAALEVPVYEAKMTGDTRLVYQIDCLPEYDSVTERQVIKIFGIYTHAQIGRGLWSSMGCQLAKQGRDYRRRCAARTRIQPGDNVFQPESFPPREQSEEDTSIIPELPKEDLEEIHSLLVLEKFVTLSKELLISILADLDVAHVFDVSPQEKEIIEHPHSCYVLGRSGTGKTTTMLFKMLGIERAYAQQSEIATLAKPRQIFVTQSRVLATRVEEYFSKLLESLATAKKSNEEIKELADRRKLQQDDDTQLFDADDDVTWKASLPPRFSLLKDEHFPLFLTFERLAQLVEGDTVLLQGKEASGSMSDRAVEGHLINYDLFLERYWPHFPQDLIRKLDPALVFSEFLGVIEGSEETLGHQTRFLDQTSYAGLSHRAQHVFATQRERIYELFKAYLKHKRQNGDVDTAERTHHILQAFHKDGVPGTKVDYLYVDEAQDNLLIDAMLLRSLCRNPNGLFWAGDTAQTIAIGSSFRFNDLKAFLYRLEQRREQKAHGDEVVQSDLQTFQLVTNYRSHGGIVHCATTVIDLITRFWPYAIDSLTPEKGVVDGAKPVFFSGWDTNTARYEQFLFGDSGERIEFGARQCILVRDEAAKDELSQQVGNIGNVLTLYESKGLEFDDVLLYNFFEDSKVELGQWRVVLNLLDRSQCGGTTAPRFNQERHAGVCTELKFLYVAITRSRKNLWIFDCSDKALPMKTLWESKGFIENCTPGGEVPRLAVSSTPEEWANTGHSLFGSGRYLQAMHAFQRGGMAHEAKIAHTHYLRQTARSTVATTKEGLLARREAFRAAAVSFLECAATSTGKVVRIYYHNAGDCYERAGNCGEDLEDYGHAANAYEGAQEYNSAVKLYRKSDRFDEAVTIIRNHRREMDPNLAESLLDVARIYYFKRKDYKKAEVLFDSTEEQLEYLEDNILLDESHADVLVELGKYPEAADVHVQEGRIMEAIKALLKDKENPSSTQRANDYILQGLWQSTSFSMKIKEDDTIAVKFLSLASKLDYAVLSPTQKDEIAMFQNLRVTANDGACFRDLGREFLRRNDRTQALLCLDHFFLNNNFGSLARASNSVLRATLEDFHDYCRLFREIVMSLDLADEGSQKLFNFQPAAIESAYRIRVGTWLYRQLTEAKVGIVESDDGGIVVSATDLLQTTKASLWRRLSKRMYDENESCRAFQLWTPCLPFVVNGDCWRQGCTRQHLHRKEMTQGWFNDQLRGLFLQIMVYQTYHSIPISKENAIPDPRRYWIHKLYETLRPQAHYMGSQACLRLEDIADQARPALIIVKKWCQDLLHTRTLEKDRMTLSFLFEAGTLCLLFDPRAAQYLPRAPTLGIFADSQFYHRALGTTGQTVYVLPELYQCIVAGDANYISAGILFFQQVVQRGLDIDLNILCHLFEFLAGSLILARLKFNLHNVMLPRGWLLHILQHVRAREANTFLIDMLVDSLQKLLHDLLHGGSGSRYLLFEGVDLAERHTLRNLFVLRVCRVLGLIGYNLPYEDLRNEIRRSLEILNVNKIHHSFKRFARLRTWGGVVVAVQASYSDSHLDDLVQLCSMDKQSEQLKGPPAGVRRVLFRSLEHASVVLAQGALRADAPAFVPTLSSKPDAEAVEEENVENAEQVIDQPEVDVTEPVDSRNLVEALSGTAAPVVEDTITEQQRVVARKFLAGYRRTVRERKLEKAKNRTQKACDSFFLTCLGLSASMDWGVRTFYKKLYLGLVPHLLTCVDVVESYGQLCKKKARTRLLDPSERDLEGLKKKMDDLNATFKFSRELRKQLEPSSALHKERDVRQLKQLVGEVQELLNRIPPGHGLTVQFNLDMAAKGIVRKPTIRIPKLQPKPQLNVEDVNDDVDLTVGDFDYDEYPTPQSTSSRSPLPQLFEASGFSDGIVRRNHADDESAHPTIILPFRSDWAPRVDRRSR